MEIRQLFWHAERGRVEDGQSDEDTRLRQGCLPTLGATWLGKERKETTYNTRRMYHQAQRTGTIQTGQEAVRAAAGWVAALLVNMDASALARHRPSLRSCA